MFTFIVYSPGRRYHQIHHEIYKEYAIVLWGLLSTLLSALECFRVFSNLGILTLVAKLCASECWSISPRMRYKQEAVKIYFTYTESSVYEVSKQQRSVKEQTQNQEKSVEIPLNEEGGLVKLNTHTGNDEDKRNKKKAREPLTDELF